MNETLTTVVQILAYGVVGTMVVGVPLAMGGSVAFTAYFFGLVISDIRKEYRGAGQLSEMDRPADERFALPHDARSDVRYRNE